MSSEENTIKIQSEIDHIIDEGIQNLIKSNAKNPLIQILQKDSLENYSIDKLMEEISPAKGKKSSGAKKKKTSGAKKSKKSTGKKTKKTSSKKKKKTTGKKKKR
jgi:hypothetical protein